MPTPSNNPYRNSDNKKEDNRTELQRTSLSSFNILPSRKPELDVELLDMTANKE